MRANPCLVLVFVPAVLAGCAGAPLTAHEAVSPYEAQRCVASEYDRNACARYASQRCPNFEVFDRDEVDDAGRERRVFRFRCL